MDSGFSNILAYPPESLPGVIVIRTPDQSKPVVIAFVRRIAAALAIHPLAGRLWIVERDRIRVRGPE